MSFKSISWYSWLMGLVFVGLWVMLSVHMTWPVTAFLSDGSLLSGLFCFDTISFYLILLSSLLWVSLLFWVKEMSFISVLLISTSIVSSLLCYCCIHALWFWIFYEMSIVPLLVLLVVESPYSERYIASWYLLGYVVFTSLPMLLCLFYLSLEGGSFDTRLWDLSGSLWVIVSFLLSMMFITKMPLPPFHVWLPIVHAEASSPVSVCLSGYMMKLGVLGVCRFCASLLPTYMFFKGYMLMCFFLSVLFFLSAARELDGKRWLAFMSLCHILVASCCLCVGSWLLGGLSFLYCLGHGLSAGVTFLFLWLAYNVSGTRNLSILKSSISGSLLFRVLACSCLCTVCSLPPTVQFFCEVSLAGEAFFNSLLFLLVLYIFLFLGGLVPLFLVGTFLARHCDVSYGGGHIYSGIFSLFFLVFWSFLFCVVA